MLRPEAGGGLPTYLNEFARDAQQPRRDPSQTFSTHVLLFCKYFFVYLYVVIIIVT